MNASVQIGWVGLGRMGSRMAPNLVKNGYSVTGFDLDRNRVAAVLMLRTALKAATSAVVARRQQRCYRIDDPEQ